eukprot:TRINITY_DN102236_c0_g1_i1.p1 TRINITY_DN102236_c0_g1~~TRINITY_DN102236_c0_g1_i1.p1  ORF type:complete len:523 (+),score=99.82 TRINITY_DN102236_c0_g1_i1:122-1570(+)
MAPTAQDQQSSAASSFEQVLLDALAPLSQEKRGSVLTTLQDHLVTSLEDLRDVSDVQFWQMAVPVGIANKLKRLVGGRRWSSAPMSFVDSSSPARSTCGLQRGDLPILQQPGGATSAGAEDAGLIEILRNRYGCRKGLVLRVTGHAPAQSRAEANWVLAGGDCKYISVPVSHEGYGWRWIQSPFIPPLDLFPYARICDEFMRDQAPWLGDREVPTQNKVFDEDIVNIPVGCLRWFDEEQRQLPQKGEGESVESAVRLYDEVLSGEQTLDCLKAPPLDIVMHTDGEEVQLYCVSGMSTLVGLMMVQSTRRHDVVRVRCVIRPPNAAFAAALRAGCPDPAMSTRSGESGTRDASATCSKDVLDHGRAAMRRVEGLAAKYPQRQQFTGTESRRGGGGHEMDAAPEPEICTSSAAWNDVPTVISPAAARLGARSSIVDFGAVFAGPPSASGRPGGSSRVSVLALDPQDVKAKTRHRPGEDQKASKR